MLYALIALCGILSFISATNSYYPLKMVAGFSWWALLFYWLSAGLVTRGTPTDVAVMGVLIMLGLLFMVWGVAGRKGNLNIEERYSSTGNLVDKIVKTTTTSKEPKKKSQMYEDTFEHRQRVRKALSSGKASRRRK